MALLEKAVPPSGDGSEPVLARAVTVAALEIYVDPETRDRIFRIHSEDEPVIELRVSPVDLTAILTRLAMTIARSLH